MKKSLFALIAFSLVALTLISPAFSATNVALDGASIATDPRCTSSTGWGPIEPTTHGGGWGKAVEVFGTTDVCRVMWAGGEPDTPEGRSATVTMDGKGSARTILITHLDGSADDSFDVYAKRGDGDYILIGSYEGQLGSENWVFNTPFDLYSAFQSNDIGVGMGKSITIKLEATGPKWGGQGTYGQVGIHEIVLMGNGQPGY